MALYQLPSGEIVNTLPLNPAMTPLQQRVAIANNALEGTDGVFRSNQARDVFNRLALEALLQPNNTLASPDDTLTPIELRYLQQILGVNPSQSPEELFRALGGVVNPVTAQLPSNSGTAATQGGSSNRAPVERESGGSDWMDRMENTRSNNFNITPSISVGAPSFGTPSTPGSFGEGGFGGREISTPSNLRDLDLNNDGKIGGFFGDMTNPNNVADYANTMEALSYQDAVDDAKAAAEDKISVDMGPLGTFSAADAVGGVIGGLVGGPVGMALGKGIGALGNFANRQMAASKVPEPQFTVPPAAVAGPAAAATASRDGGGTTGSLRGTSADTGFSATGRGVSDSSIGTGLTGMESGFGSMGRGGLSSGEGGGGRNGFSDRETTSSIGGTSASGGIGRSSGFDSSIGTGLTGFEGGFGSTSSRGSSSSRGGAGGGGFQSTGDRGGSSSSSRGGCWIYSTLYDLKLIKARYNLIMLRYHLELQSELDYAGYDMWSKPFSKLFYKYPTLANAFSYMAPIYADVKAYRLGILKKKPSLAHFVFESAWNLVNRIAGITLYAKNRLMSSSTSNQTTN